jgi:hypothetical protein
LHLGKGRNKAGAGVVGRLEVDLGFDETEQLAQEKVNKPGKVKPQISQGRWSDVF